MVGIDTIRTHDANYNSGDVDAITDSIMINGMYRPLYVQASTRQIIAGNHSWEACKKLGAEEIPAVFIDVDDTHAYAIMIADNRIANLARPDPGLLVNLLEHVDQHAEHHLAGTGYTDEDLTMLKHLAEIPVEFDEHAQWPTISIQVPPHVRRAYLDLTSEAIGDLERFQLLLRLAGWDGT
jgi:ParB family chromosome partitioning protein